MGNIAKKIIGYDFLQKNKGYITREGVISDVLFYFTLNDVTEMHYIDQNYFPSEKLCTLQNSIHEISCNYIPLKIQNGLFRKFITEELMKSLFITREISTLFNTYLLYKTDSEEDYLCREDIKEILLPLFEVTKTDSVKQRKDQKVYYYKFKEEKVTKK